MLTNLKKAAYTRDWNNPSDFPSWEADEDTVRFDMQYLFEEIRQWVNNLIDNIKSANIPFGPVAGVTGDTIEDAMTDLKRQLDEAVIGGLVPDNSVTLQKLASDVTTKLNELIGTSRLQDGSVTEAKLAVGAVTPTVAPALQKRRIRVISGEIQFNGTVGVHYNSSVTSDSAVVVVPVDSDYTSWMNHGVHYYSVSSGQINFRATTSLGTTKLYGHIIILN